MCLPLPHSQPLPHFQPPASNLLLHQIAYTHQAPQPPHLLCIVTLLPDTDKVLKLNIVSWSIFILHSSDVTTKYSVLRMTHMYHSDSLLNLTSSNLADNQIHLKINKVDKTTPQFANNQATWWWYRTELSIQE